MTPCGCFRPAAPSRGIPQPGIAPATLRTPATRSRARTESAGRGGGNAMQTESAGQQPAVVSPAGTKKPRNEGGPRRRGQMIPRGNRKWLLRVFLGRDGLGRKRYGSKTVEGTTAQALQEMTRMLHEADKGALVAPSKLTLAAYVEEWYRTKVRVAESTLNGYRLQMKLYVLPHLGYLR